MSAVTILQQRIALLNAESDREQLAIDRATEMIAKAKSRKAIVDATLENLRGVISELEDADDSESIDDDPLDGLGLDSGKPSAAIAVRQLLEKHPDGLTIRDVVDQLENAIATKSSTPKRVLQNTVYQMRVAEKLDQFTNSAGLDCVRLRYAS